MYTYISSYILLINKKYMNTVCCILPSNQNCLHELLCHSNYRDRRYHHPIFGATYPNTFITSIFRVVLSIEHNYTQSTENENEYRFKILRTMANYLSNLIALTLHRCSIHVLVYVFIFDFLESEF